MTRLLIAAVTFSTLTVGAVSPSFSKDACAGQVWPNLSEACIDQMVEKVADIVNKKNKSAGNRASVNAVKVAPQR